MRSGVSAHRWTVPLRWPPHPSHEPEVNSPPLCSPRPAILGGTACATETPGWRSPHAPAPRALPILPLPTSVRRSAVSPLPPTADVSVLVDQPSAPKCPPIPQVDTIASAHFGHHPHLTTLRLDGQYRTLTILVLMEGEILKTETRQNSARN